MKNPGQTTDCPVLGTGTYPNRRYRLRPVVDAAPHGTLQRRPSRSTVQTGGHGAGVAKRRGPRGRSLGASSAALVSVHLRWWQRWLGLAAGSSLSELTQNPRCAKSVPRPAETREMVETGRDKRNLLTWTYRQRGNTVKCYKRWSKAFTHQRSGVRSPPRPPKLLQVNAVILNDREPRGCRLGAQCPKSVPTAAMDLLPVGRRDPVGAVGVRFRESEPAEIWCSVGLYDVPEIDNLLTI